MEESSSSSSARSTSSWDKGKLFVGGISWHTEASALRDYFGKYGEVTEAVAVKDRETGNPRGFGFVLFADPDSAERAIGERDPHVILDKTVEVRRARPRSLNNQNQDQHENEVLSNSHTNNIGNNGNHSRSRKIFVGGLSSDITEDEFRSYFEQFGVVIDVVVIYDSITHRSRGFGFVEFASVESVDKVLKRNYHKLKNKYVEAKPAVPKDLNNYRNTDNHGKHYNSRMDGGVAPSVFGNYQAGYYPTYDPRYGGYFYPPSTLSGYNYGATGYGGGYIGGYARAGYGPPFASPSSYWNDQGLVAAAQNPVPFDNATMYRGYPNGGIGGYYGTANLQTPPVDAITSQVESLKLDAR